MGIISTLVIFIAGLAIGSLLTGVVISSKKKKEESLQNDAARFMNEEKERAFQKILEEKQDAFSKILQEKENGFAQILQEKEDNYVKTIQSRENAYNTAFSRMEEHHADALNSLQLRFDETVAKMQAQLQATTSGMLKERQNEFQSSSSEKIAAILQPLKENIAGMKEAMTQNSKKQDEFAGLFSANIENLLKHGEATRSSAEKLANALRSNGKIQGEWGETVLTELLEGQGLVEGIHFDTQSTLRDDSGNIRINSEGKAMRPDVILHLDKKRDVVIDAKVSLSDYLDYINSDSPEQREAAAAAHVASIERHVKELARKDYSAYLGKGKANMGYVIMFVPNTTALLLATTRKPDLWRNAMEKNVYIADEQTLYAALKIISITWSQIAQAENHEQLYKLADEMMNRVRQFMEKYVEIGKKIDDAKISWDGGMIKLRDSGQSIPQTCAKLIKLGVKKQSGKNVPADLLGENLTELLPSAEDSAEE